MKRKQTKLIGNQREFIKLVEGLARRHQIYDVFCDFLTMASSAIIQRFCYEQKREDEYLQIVSKYSKQELDELARLFAVVTMALENNPEQDFLGSVFGELELANKWRGQFFTPYHIASLMVRLMTSASKINAIPYGRYITLNEPCIGAGVTIIATYNYLRSSGVDTNHKVFAYAQDIDGRAAQMAYIQLSLLDIPALIGVGNTLAPEPLQTIWPTPAYFLYNWDYRLKYGHSALSIPPSIELKPLSECIWEQQELFA